MIHVRSNDGARIAVYNFNRNAGETVLLLHGWPLSHKIYEYQIEMLVNYGFRVVAIDLRGFGNSDAPSSGYTYNQMARDVSNVVRFLGLRDFTLAGFSMGGAIALRYMRIFRGYGVKKLILLAAAAPCFTQRAGYPYGQTTEAVNQLIALARTDRPQLAYNFSHEMLFASPQSEPAKRWFEDIALSASGIATVQTAIALRDEDGRQDLACVKVPTRIIHGTDDIVVTSDLVMYQHEHIGGSVLRQIQNCGHGMTYDQLKLFNGYFLEAIRN